MKKLIAIFLAVLTVLCCFCRCGEMPSKTPEIVVTIYPLYDFARQILGDNPAGLEIELLQKNGTDLHNYQPTAEDTALIGTSKLFAYIGGESDEWTQDVLATAGGDGRRICLMDTVQGLEEEAVEGMQEAEEEEEEGAFDEHIWLSLRNAQSMIDAMCEEICAIDPDHADLYRANADAYIASLDSLDTEYQTAVETASFDTILVADRFPFRYLAADYGLKYYAAFSGCAASLDVSFETVAFLSEKLTELRLPAVLIIDGSDGEVARTVIDTADLDVPVLTLHSCQCVSSEELESGVSYLDIMTSNLEVLKEALNG